MHGDQCVALDGDLKLAIASVQVGQQVGGPGEFDGVVGLGGEVGLQLGHGQALQLGLDLGHDPTEALECLRFFFVQGANLLKGFEVLVALWREAASVGDAGQVVQKDLALAGAQIAAI